MMLGTARGFRPCSMLHSRANQRTTFFCSCKLFNYKWEKWLRALNSLCRRHIVANANSNTWFRCSFFCCFKSQFSHLFSSVRLQKYLNSSTRKQHIPASSKLTHVFVLFWAVFSIAGSSQVCTTTREEKMSLKKRKNISETKHSRETWTIFDVESLPAAYKGLGRNFVA